MNHLIVKIIRCFLAVLLILSAFMFQYNAAKAQSAANVTLNLPKITAFHTTSSDHVCVNLLFDSICPNDRDETYLVVAGATSNGESISIPRVSPPAPEDYYQFWDNTDQWNIPLWTGSLQPHEAAYLVVTVREQDNAQLDAIERAAKGVALGIGAIFIDPSLGSAATGELEAAAKSFVDSLSADGDDTIGAFSVRIENDGQSITASWTPIGPTNTISQDSSSASMKADGAGANYWFRAQMNAQQASLPLAVCHDAVQGKIAWDYNGSTNWNATNITRLCAGGEYSVQPARCFDRVMHDAIDWGGGVLWRWENALNLCEGTNNADATISCFQRNIQQGQNWQNAIAMCDERSITTCHDAVQGRIAWNYTGSTTWNEVNVTNLCMGNESSLQPALCFDRVMHGDIDWGGGTRWQWNNALDLCKSTTDAYATIGCFQNQIQRGQDWQSAIGACK